VCKNRNNRLIIFGDFNFPNINWDSHSVTNLEVADFLKCIQENFLCQYVEGPTRDGAVLGNKVRQEFEVAS